MNEKEVKLLLKDLFDLIYGETSNDNLIKEYIKEYPNLEYLLKDIIPKIDGN